MDRIKFGLNPYSQEFWCAHCNQKFLNAPEDHNIFVELEIDGKIVQFPICPKCMQLNALFETQWLDLSKNDASHPIGIA